nr:MAG TPA_asm: hypothetical protein [Caudoviricetes sp.]
MRRTSSQSSGCSRSKTKNSLSDIFNTPFSCISRLYITTIKRKNQ